MDRAQKEAAVAELAEKLGAAQAVLAIDYRGISVPQASELRSGLRESGTTFKVVKNRVTQRAADQAGVEGIKEYLVGPTALAFVEGDVAAAAKTLSTLGGEWELLEYKGGLMDGEPLDADQFKTISKLPGRDALNAQLAGIVASPLTGLVRGLGSMLQGLASQLGQMRDQELVGGTAEPEAPAEEEQPAEEPAAEAEEAPAEEAPAEAEEAPAEEAPAEEEKPAEAEEAPAEEAPTEEEKPADELAAEAEEEKPAEEDEPAEEPAEEAPAQEDEPAAEEDSDKQASDEGQEEKEDSE